MVEVEGVLVEVSLVVVEEVSVVDQDDILAFQRCERR